MAISFGGLASGLDSQTIINGLMQAERVPLNRLQSQVQLVNGAKDGLQAFMGKVSALLASATTLSTPTGYTSVTSTSSSTAISPSATGGAQPASYSIDVLALAHEQRTRSDTFASGTTALGQSGTLGIKIGAGAQVNVTINATDDLATVATNINSSGARVSASVLFDGSQYRLLVRGLDSGASNSIALTESGTTLGLSTPANTYQAATDAHIKVDGIDVTRSTNLVSGAIPGVSFALSDLTTTTAKLTVASDPGALTTKLQSFVSAYNDVVSSAHVTAGYGTLKASNSRLAGDSTIRTTLERVSRAFGDTVAGTSGKYQSFASVGLSSTRDGSITLDTVKLSAALQDDPTAVSKLFIVDPSIGATGGMGRLKTTIDALMTGNSAPLQTRLDAFGTESTRLGNDVTRETDRMTATETALKKKFSDLEVRISQIKSSLSGLSALGINTTG
jgi:flagellar hook-associated protein 2